MPPRKLPVPPTCGHATTTNADVIKRVKSWSCKECGEDENVWMCLKCSHVGCGRYAKQHAKTHYEKTGHFGAIQIHTLQAFCYLCDDDIIKEPKPLRTVRQALQALIQDDVRSPSPRLEGASQLSNDALSQIQGRVGFLNLGNTCYANSVIQCLSNTPGFRRYLLSVFKAKDLKHTQIDFPVGAGAGCSGLGSPEGAGAVVVSPGDKRKHFDDEFEDATFLVGGKTRAAARRRCDRLEAAVAVADGRVSLVEELRSLLRVVWQPKPEASTLSPDAMLTAVWAVLPRFSGFLQHDSHEFLRMLLDRVHTELSGRVGGVGAGGHSVVQSLFGGKLLSKVQCRKCNRVSETIDPFLDLSLDVPHRPEGKAVGIVSCLHQFMENEELGESELYRCGVCRSKQEAYKQFHIATLPPVLCVHLKRFAWAKDKRVKVTTRVEFPLEALDMQAFVMRSSDLTPLARSPSRRGVKQTTRLEQQLYDLIAVVVHHGGGAVYGHYTAFCKNDTGVWLNYNDGNVTAATPQEVQASQAYILMYQRRGS